MYMKGNVSQNVNVHMQSYVFIISAAKLVLVKFNCSSSRGFNFIFELHHALTIQKLCVVKQYRNWFLVSPLRSDVRIKQLT